MKLKLEHRFECTPEQYWEIVADHEVDLEMAAASDGEYELLFEHDEDGITTRRQRIIMNRELPAAMTKVLGSDRIGYELETRIDNKASRSEWTITPLVLPDRISGAGVAVVTATKDGCLRIIEGDLKVRVPILGKKMEERLVADVSKSYDRSAEIIHQRAAALKG